MPAIAWILIPVLSVFLFSLVVQPLFQYHYFIGSLPAAALLSGIFYQNAERSAPPVQWAGWIVLAVLIMPGYLSLQNKGTGYSEATRYISSLAGEKDRVIAYPFFKGDHYKAYLERQSGAGDFLYPVPIHAAAYLPGGGGVDPDPDLRRLDSLASVCQRIFLICNPAPREADQRQNRIWLPRIHQVLAVHFPRQDTFIFRPEYASPTRLIVYRK